MNVPAIKDSFRCLKKVAVGLLLRAKTIENILLEQLK
jgi:hypothetical protein